MRPRSRSGDQHPAGGERAGPVPVGQTAAEWSGDQEARRSGAACRCRPERVSLETYPCSGSQIPCSQMMRMNCRPPRASEERKPAMLPAVNVRIRKRSRWNIGSATRRSTKTNRTSIAPPSSAADDPGVAPAHGGATVGLDGVGDADQECASPTAKARCPSHVDALVADRRLVEHEVGPNGAEEPEGARDTRNTSRHSMGPARRRAPDRRRSRDHGDLVDSEGKPR